MSELRPLTVRLFAGAAEAAGCRSLVIWVPPIARVEDVSAAVVFKLPQLQQWVDLSRWAVGNEFISTDDKISAPISEIAMIPPVSGG